MEKKMSCLVRDANNEMNRTVSATSLQEAASIFLGQEASPHPPQAKGS
jgi:hypothetical protein